MDKLYCSYDASGLYCAVTFYDDINNVTYYRHELCLSYTPDSDGLLDLDVWIDSNGSPSFELYQFHVSKSRFSLFQHKMSLKEGSISNTRLALNILGDSFS